MKLSARGRAVTYSAAAIIGIAAVTVLIWYLLLPRYMVEAAYVSGQPVLDGNGGDAVWSEADFVDLPVKNGDPVQVKAVYTGDKAFFQVRIKDSTKDDVDEPWTFDGANWKRGRTSDQCALFFDIDESLIDFDKKGFEIMDFGFKPGEKLWQFGITGKTSDKEIWAGAQQRADVWMMHSSISSPWGMGDDGYFAVNPQYVVNPTATTPLVWVQWDKFNTSGVLKLNTNIWQQAILASEAGTGQPVTAETPYLKYADPEKNIANTPYPFEDDMVEITDFTEFKKGDQLPWVYFSREAKGKWGDSRNDIMGKMAHKDGYWTVEMGRKLDTGNFDDVAMTTGEDEIINFGILARTDGSTIRYSVPAKLSFGPKGGN